MNVYSASELGSCTKYLVGKRLGYEPPPSYGSDIPAFQRGHETEQEVLTWLQSPSQGWTITRTQPEYYLPMPDNAEGEKVAVICHPDAIGAQLGGPEHAIEIKRCADAAYNDIRINGWEHARHLFPRYRWQVSCYFHATGLPVLFVARNSEVGKDGEVKTFTDTMDSVPPLYSLNDIQRRVAHLESLALNHDLPLDCDYPNHLCPLDYLHEYEFQSNPELEKLAIQYDEVRKRGSGERKQERYERQLLRNRLMHILGVDLSNPDGKSHSIDTGQVKVTASWGPTSFPYVDYAELERRGIKREEVVKKGKQGYRLNVTVRKPKGER